MPRLLVLCCCCALMTAGESGWTEWPNWRGPFCNGSAIDCGKPLVDSLADARQVWESDAEIPPGDDSAGIWFSGGYGSPIVYDGKVILQYFIPSGDVVDEKLAESKGIKRLAGQHAEWGRQRCLVDADDVIHAFDLKTGKTAWKAVFAGKGINHNGSSQKGGGHWIPCAGDGKVYAIGTTGRIYCVDASSGAPVWEGDNGEHHAYMEERKQKALATKTHMQASSGRGGYANSCPIYAGGVAAFPQGDLDHTKKINQGKPAANLHGLVGLDGKSGEENWRIGGIMRNGSSPLRWVHGGKEYIIALGSQATCIDPATGKVLWQNGGVVGNFGYAGNTGAVSEKYLVGGGKYERVRPEGGGKKVAKGDCLACLEVTPAGAKKLWGLDIEKYGGLGYNSPAIHGDYAYMASTPRKGSRAKDLLKVALATGEVEVLKVGKQASSTSLVLTDGRFLMVSGCGPDWMVDVAASPMKELGAKEFKAASPGLTPCVVDGLMIVRNQTRLVCYDLKK